MHTHVAGNPLAGAPTALVDRRPGAGALAVVWLIGLYALLFGALLIALSLRLRAHQPLAGSPR